MTTIAYRDGILAGDTCGTNGGSRLPGTDVKLFELSGRRIAATVGASGAAMRLMRWAEEWHDRWAYEHACRFSAPIKPGAPPQPECRHGARVVFIDSEGRVYVFECGGSYREPPDAAFHAWGSGAAVALGAMYAGASAEEAVRIACKVDENSAEPVMTLACENAVRRAARSAVTAGGGVTAAEKAEIDRAAPMPDTSRRDETAPADSSGGGSRA